MLHVHSRAAAASTIRLSCRHRLRASLRVDLSPDVFTRGINLKSVRGSARERYDWDRLVSAKANEVDSNVLGGLTVEGVAAVEVEAQFSQHGAAHTPLPRLAHKMLSC